jgi:hypothetical protein
MICRRRSGSRLSSVSAISTPLPPLLVSSNFAGRYQYW